MNARLVQLFERLRPIARRLPGPAKRYLRRRCYPEAADASVEASVRMQMDSEYQARVAAETSTFSGQVEVHDLPPIFHYWSNQWLRPQLEVFGFSNPDQFFAQYLGMSHADAVAAGRRARFVSLGSGNCDTEIRVAALLKEAGCNDFSIVCVDINETMLARGRQLAREHSVEECLDFVRGDFNAWEPVGGYDAVIANQSLHHVVNLEGLFDAVAASLVAGGRFITSDMIGRNGHQRWPEALALVNEFWRELPDSYRRNMQLKRQEETFLDWDCSVVGFEGIRSQDILPLLIEKFAFEFFFAYGNVIDPFIDRSFGPNFDATQEWDRAFIDRIHLLDEREMLAGRISPTHMMAVMREKAFSGKTLHRHGLGPGMALRKPQSVL